MSARNCILVSAFASHKHRSYEVTRDEASGVVLSTSLKAPFRTYGGEASCSTSLKAPCALVAVENIERRENNTAPL